MSTDMGCVLRRRNQGNTLTAEALRIAPATGLQGNVALLLLELCDTIGVPRNVELLNSLIHTRVNLPRTAPNRFPGVAKSFTEVVSV